MIPLIMMYLFMCILTTVILNYKGGFRSGDEFFMGVLSLFSPVFLPIFLIGFIGRWISEKIFDWRLRR